MRRFGNPTFLLHIVKDCSLSSSHLFLHNQLKCPAFFIFTFPLLIIWDRIPSTMLSFKITWGSLSGYRTGGFSSRMSSWDELMSSSDWNVILELEDPAFESFIGGGKRKLVDREERCKVQCQCVERKLWDPRCNRFPTYQVWSYTWEWSDGITTINTAWRRYFNSNHQDTAAIAEYLWVSSEGNYDGSTSLLRGILTLFTPKTWDQSSYVDEAQILGHWVLRIDNHTQLITAWQKKNANQTKMPQNPVARAGHQHI